MNVFKGMEFGLKTYIKQGAFGALKMVNKSSFGKKHTDASGNNINMGYLITVVILMIVSLVFGIMAVPIICSGSDIRSQNVRLGLYAMLLVTQGQAAWLYILLWILGVKF